MDRHMDNKHADRLNLARSDDIDHDIEPAPGRCLGDLCPELGCGDYAADTCSVEIHAGGGASLGAGAGKIRRGCGACDPADMERRRRRCRALFHGYVVAWTCMLVRSVLGVSLCLFAAPLLCPPLSLCRSCLFL